MLVINITEVISMGKINNIQGQKFNMLTVISQTNERIDRKVVWLCKCDCGNYTKAIAKDLISNNKKSCGCLKYATHNMTHGLSKTRIYKIWLGIKKRCYNPTSGSYKHYGKRGIIMCDEWKNDFMAFYNWAMTNGYTDKLSIERNNVNGNYEPSNCCWIALAKQSCNTRKTRYVTYNGETKSLSTFCKELNISRTAVIQRVKRGDTYEQAIHALVIHAPRKKTINSGCFKPSLFFTIDGVTKSLHEWCKEYDIPYGRALKRYESGWDIVKALTTPKLH